eukprot:2238450-Prymnesium_polylepis.1
MISPSAYSTAIVHAPGPARRTILATVPPCSPSTARGNPGCAHLLPVRPMPVTVTRSPAHHGSSCTPLPPAAAVPPSSIASPRMSAAMACAIRHAHARS